MTHRVMFVCAMNVCRSPLMAFVFFEALATGSDPAGWEVTSRGTSVLRSDPMCEVSASLITGSEAGDAFVETHASKPLVAAELESQGLILVASRAERSKIAHLNPGLRSSTFTVREALALGAPPVTQADLEIIGRTQTSDHKPRIEDYAQFLHQRRGTVAIPARRPSLWSFRPRENPADIPDVHHKKSAEHAARLKTARVDVQKLHDQVRAFWSARAGL